MLKLIDNFSLFIMFFSQKVFIATGKYRPPNFILYKLYDIISAGRK